MLELVCAYTCMCMCMRVSVRELCVCVLMHVHVPTKAVVRSIFMSVGIRVCLNTCIICMYVCVCVCVCVCVYICAYLCLESRVHLYKYACARMSGEIRNKYIMTHVCLREFLHVRTCMCMCPLALWGGFLKTGELASIWHIVYLPL
jgi:hypothetical protein